MCLLGTRTRKGICTSSTRECSTKTRRREESTGKVSSGIYEFHDETRLCTCHCASWEFDEYYGVY